MLNKVILIGNLGRDPEVRYLPSGDAVANFSIATSENWKDRNGQRQERTEWHNIVVWRGLAEVVEKYVRKGSKLFIEGKITSRSYEDKSGVKRYVTEITAENLELLNRLNATSDDNQMPSQPAQGNQYDYTDSISNMPDDSDLPF